MQGIEKQLPQNCPQAKVQERGAAKLAGLPGSFLVVHCDGQDGPQTMKFTAASKPGVVALMVTNSPGEAFLRTMMPLESIHNSLKILPAGQGQGAGATAGAGDGGQGAQGAMGGNAPMNGDGGQGDAGTYRDPQGRFSLAVPSGWNSASDNGNLTLSSGASWVTVATGSGGQPSEENRQIVQQIQAQYKDFKILNEGDFQSNGHPSHGTNATGINPKGQRVSVLVVSIGAGSGHYLVLISSSPNDQAQQINGAVMQIAQSVKF